MVEKVKYLWSFSGQELLKLYLLLLNPVTELWCPNSTTHCSSMLQSTNEAQPILRREHHILALQTSQVGFRIHHSETALAAHGNASHRLWWWEWDLRGLFSAEVLCGAWQFWPAALSLPRQKTGSNFYPWTSVSSVSSLGLSGKQVEMALVRISHTGNTNKGIKMSFENWVPTEDKRLWNSLYKPY